MKVFFSFAVFMLLFNACQNDNKNNQAQTDSWGISHIVKADSLNPILQPSHEVIFKDPVSGKNVFWEARNVLNPAAIVNEHNVYLLYRAQDSMGTSRIGLAVSDDGLHFSKTDTPVLFPENDSLLVYEWNYRKFTGDTDRECVNCYFDGVEDPRIVLSPQGDFIMTYTAYDGKTARLSLATSKDLFHWEKYGPILKEKKYSNFWSKSGAIITQKNELGQLVAAKIEGKYWMYFGDTDLFMAVSENLINWSPLTNPENGQLIRVLSPRPGYFDSRLVEPGPFALIEKEAISLIYNASNAADFNSKQLPKFTYTASEALFDLKQPYKLIDRKTDYFIYPDKPYEKEGEVNEVCFVEGRIFFNEKQYLYYGTADSKIAVAEVK